MLFEDRRGKPGGSLEERGAGEAASHRTRRRLRARSPRVRRSTRAGRSEDRPVDRSGGEGLVTPETQQAIDAGLAFLAARQDSRDGSFGTLASSRRRVAVTALAGMAFLSSGSTPGRGKYGAQVQKAVDFLLSRFQPNGFIFDEGNTGHGPMYDHGFATLFLAEVYGMTRTPRVRNSLERAVQLIVNSQNKEGGWRYEPDAKDADLSVTICEVMALRAARNAGIFVPKETIDRCTEYVHKCQTPEGGFRYQLATTWQVTFGLTAAGVVALYSAGVYQGKSIEAGLRYIERYRPGLAPCDSRPTIISTVITTPCRRCGTPAASAGSYGTRTSATSCCNSRFTPRREAGAIRRPTATNTRRRWPCSSCKRPTTISPSSSDD